MDLARAQWLEPLLEQLALAKDHRTLVMPTLDIIPEAWRGDEVIKLEHWSSEDAMKC